MMKLIIINGPCGVGKSTIAEKVHSSIPLLYLIDVDDLGRKLSNYRDYKEKRWSITLSLTLAMINALFSEGISVIIDKMTHDENILDKYVEVAEKYNAEIKEIILWADKDTVMSRANERGYKEDGVFTPEKCELFWEKITELKEHRSSAMIIDTSEMAEDDVVQNVIEKVQ